ncbi:hypothetical protein [Sphingomonas sinipercae]|uniref:hypothetical protein n=1 Tax=Sphingomonas sinipercae TaxID=2714944 RepID=UPI003CCCA532
MAGARQETVGDVAYMEAMIPHHSLAIMTSKRTDAIIAAQVREIAEMKRHIARPQAHPGATGSREGENTQPAR